MGFDPVTRERPVSILEADAALCSPDFDQRSQSISQNGCPFHHWEYSPNDRCIRIPAEQPIPSFARQTTYPVIERHDKQSPTLDALCRIADALKIPASEIVARVERSPTARRKRH